VRRVALWIIFVVMALVLLAPSWIMISNSFSAARAFLRRPPSIFPADFTLQHYKKIFALPFLPRWTLNTLLILGVTVVAGVLINGAAGYVFAFSRERWARWLFWAFMAPIFVSGYVLIISRFQIVGWLHLPGLAAVLLMSMFWPTGIFLFRNYFRAIPISLVESARLDGASEWAILTRVVLPLSKPIMGTAIVFLGMGALGSYVWPMLNLQTQASQTYLVGLMSTTLVSYGVKEIGYNLAVGTMVFIPYMALFIFSSRYFISGLTGGAMKE